MTDNQRPAILLIAQALNLGGSERQLCEMALALDRAAVFRVHVGSFRTGGFREDELARRGIPLVQFPVRSFRSPIGLWSAARALRQYVATNRIDLVHAFDAPASLFVGLARPLIKSAVVLSSQRSSRDLLPRWHRWGLRLTDRLVDGIVVNCRAVLEHLGTDEGVPSTRIHLCYNGLDLARFPPSSDRASPGGPCGLVVGTLCALRPEKRLQILLRAFAGSHARFPALSLLIVGDGPELGSLKQLAADLRIESACRFQPAVGDVAPWLSQMHVFVLPSRTEALSNSLMEAMASKCACIASRVGGNPELLTHGETGLLFAEGNLAELTSHLEAVASDEDLTRRLGQAASRRVVSMFSLETAAARLTSIYLCTQSSRHNP